MLKTPPSKEELGYIDEVYVDELGDTSIVVFKMEGRDCRISTIVIRGSTDNYMDDIERAIDDGVNTFKCFTKVRYHLFYSYEKIIKILCNTLTKLYSFID